jgi:hypothetical protein
MAERVMPTARGRGNGDDVHELVVEQPGDPLPDRRLGQAQGAADLGVRGSAVPL